MGPYLVAECYGLIRHFAGGSAWDVYVTSLYPPAFRIISLLVFLASFALLIFVMIRAAVGFLSWIQDHVVGHK